MLNPESVDYNKDKWSVLILFTDGRNECLTIHLEVTDARRLARMILKRTAWDKKEELWQRR